MCIRDSYKGDARFNQFAKRCISERALSHDMAHTPDPQHSTDVVHESSFASKCKKLGLWVWSKAKGKICFSILVGCFIFVLLSRPLFYVVIAKALALCVRVALRRSFGLLVVLLDAILDEAVANLEPTLIAPPHYGAPPPYTPHTFELQQPFSLSGLLLHGLCTLIGAMIGHRWPRANRRPP